MGKSKQAKIEASLRAKAQGKVQQQLAIVPPQTEFSSFAELTKYSKDCVYVIARLRQTEEGTLLSTLGTGFLASPFRLMSCDHVFNFNETTKHEDNDKYLLVQRDEFGHGHRFLMTLKVEETLFFYPETDTAVVYLPKDFYSSVGRDPNKHLRLARDVYPLGTETGVLGYPMMEIELLEDKSDIEVSSVILRVDMGVINSAYVNSEGVSVYEFTMSFNPGNSGGPILDTKSGKVISIVKAYNSIRLQFIKEDVPESEQERIGAESVTSTIRALYSRGVATTNILHLEKTHQINFY